MGIKQISLISVIITLSLLLTYCDGFESETGPDVQSGSGEIKGLVQSFNGDALSGVTVIAGGISSITDSEGAFLISGVAPGARVLVDFSLQGHVSTQKIVKVEDKKQSYTEVSLAQIGLTKIINTSSDETISFQGVKVELGANSFVDSKGNAYTGNATVTATYFDPATEKFTDAFPGEFMGIEENGAEVNIESYGFIDIEFKNGEDLLQLADGKKAKITMPVPQFLNANAPATMPLWYYDKNDGKWKEYGQATKEGNVYVGEVSHFSTINLDQKFDELSKVKGRVVDHKGNPLPRAWIKFVGIDFTVSRTGHTDPDGTFMFINAKANSQAKVIAYYGGFYSEEIIFTTAPDGQVLDLGDIEIYIDPNLVSGWVIKYNASSSIRDVQFFDESKGWALVSTEGIIHTSDGGDNWSMIYEFPDNPTDSSGNGNLTMLDEMNGWLIFSENYSTTEIYRTIDGGYTWNVITNAPANNIQHMEFVDIDYGWVSNNQDVWRTTDGGQNWTILQNTPNDKYFQGLYFIDRDNGFIHNYAGLWKTTNGGDDWTKIDVGGGQREGNYKLFFTDLQTGWIVVGGYNNSQIYKTTDGGTSWTEQTYDGFGTLRSLYFRDSQLGWMAGTSGTVIHTSNGGDTWTTQFTGIMDNLTEVFFIDDHKGWISGGDYTNGVILYTETAGKSN